MIAAAPLPPRTIADLPAVIERLGAIPPSRIRLQPLPGKATEDDLLRVIESKFDFLCELVDRTLVEKPAVGIEDNFITASLTAILGTFVKSRRLGVVLGAQAPMRMTGGNVRLPDVGFVCTAQWRAWRKHRPAIANFAPELAVEVLSPENTKAEMARKRREYFASGSRLVWEINPRRRAVAVYTTPTKSTRLTETDILTGGDILPGFAVPIADLFKDPRDD